MRPLPFAPASPAGDDAAAWRRWFHALAERRAILGRRTLAEALVLAYGAAQVAWHRQHGAKPGPGRCAGCREPIGSDSVLALPDGAAVHSEGLDCLIAYGRGWRGAAEAGLQALGIEPPQGWQR